ncbi:MAG: hypothetical protein GQ574_25120 [Crocinitomix sp.]|nr:hypothetical protein [Crocinitomix sp.]
MSFLNIVCLIFTVISFCSCSETKSAEPITEELIENRSIDYWFSDKRKGDFEYDKIRYINSILETHNSDTINLYEVYVDSIFYQIKQLSAPNRDGLSYSDDSLVIATNNYLAFLTAFHGAEQDPNPGNQYYIYRQDDILYDLISYYFKVKSLR